MSSVTPASRCAAESRMQCKVTFAILVPSVTAPCGEGTSLAPAIPRVKMNRACRSPAHVTAVEHKETDSLLTSTRPRWNSLRPLS